MSGRTRIVVDAPGQLDRMPGFATRERLASISAALLHAAPQPRRGLAPGARAGRPYAHLAADYLAPYAERLCAGRTVDTKSGWHKNVTGAR
jgi:hypothetical protein